MFAATRLSQLRRLSSGSWGGAKTLAELVASFEKEVLVEALHGAQGDLSAAAKKLGLDRAGLDARLKELGIVGPVPPPAAPGAAEWKSVQV
jgi:DNA-binding NtrC family response regulator